MPKTAKAKPDDALRASGALLTELNRELDRRFGDLPGDLQALLVQKGAVTQCILREFQDLLDQAAARIAHHEELISRCRSWRDQFLIPLKQQCDGVTVDAPVYTTHLEAIIEEANDLLRRANAFAESGAPRGPAPDSHDEAAETD